MPGVIQGPRTLYDKVFDSHIVNEDDGNVLLYIDRECCDRVVVCGNG